MVPARSVRVCQKRPPDDRARTTNSKPQRPTSSSQTQRTKPSQPSASASQSQTSSPISGFCVLTPFTTHIQTRPTRIQGYMRHASRTRYSHRNTATVDLYQTEQPVLERLANAPPLACESVPQKYPECDWMATHTRRHANMTMHGGRKSSTVEYRM